MEKVYNKYFCNICNKKYKSYQSLWNHNKRFHSHGSEKHPKAPGMLRNAPYAPKFSENNETVNEKITCEFCKKEFSKKSNLNRHINLNRCKVKNDILEKEKLVMKEEFKKELEKVKHDMRIEMMDIIKKSCKMHPKTLQKINNQLNNCNIINIVQLGKEDVVGTLSSKDKLNILNNKYLSFNKLIEHVHFNDKYPQFKNIAITNLKDDYAYKFNDKENKFIACKKEEVIDELMDYRTIDLEEILNENIDKINNFDVKKIKDLIVKLYDKSELYENNKKDIKLMIYNKCDKNDIIV